MAEKVSMPVKCLGEMCINCPELEIAVNALSLSSFEKEVTCNELRCVHLDRCRGIYLMVKGDWEENHVTRLEHDL